MNMWRSLKGMVTVRLLSADLPGAMDAVNRAQIPIEEAIYLDELHLQFSVLRQDLPMVEKIAYKRGDRLEVLNHKGSYYRIRRLLKRPILTMGLLGIFLFSLWMPTRVFFVQVEGNDSIPTRKIIEVASSCGIGFGASRREVRSEKIKNALLAAMPDLQWAGVNTYGCRAVITVRERNQEAEKEEKPTVSSIVALRDALVREVTVLKGNALCKPGQVVKTGEVLVSGYTDCGICIQATEAQGEIFGETVRRLTAIFPTEYMQRTKILTSSKKYSLIIGKKRINFLKGSGISGTTCAKIYEENYLTLPGGFVLPIALCSEQWYDYEVVTTTAGDIEQMLSDFAANYLPGQMLAGKITTENQLFFHDEAYSTLEGIYSCYEMIGITRPEERLNE